MEGLRPLRLFAFFLFSLSLWTGLGTGAPQNPEADHYQRGVKLLEQRLWDAAIFEFREVLELDPNQAETYIALGIAHSNKNELEEALKAFGRAAELKPDSVEAHFNLGLALRNAGRMKEAVSELEEAIRLDPLNEQSRLELGLILQRDGQSERSIEQYRAILERNPNSAAAHNWLGVGHQQKKEFVEAIAEFRRAVELDPAMGRAHNSLGTLLAETGEMEEAVESFQTAARLDPSNLEIRMNLGVALRTIGDSEKAVEQFRHVLDEGRKGSAAESGANSLRRTSVAEVYYQLAQTLRQGQDLDGAVAAYEEALALNPEMRESYYSLGQTLKQKSARVPRPETGNREPVPEAERHFETARNAVGRGDIETAKVELAKAIAAAPSFAPAHDLMGFLLGAAR